MYRKILAHRTTKKLLFLLIAMVFTVAILSQVNWAKAEDKFIERLAYQEPPFNKLPPKAKIDYKGTIKYKKQKLQIFKEGIKDSFLLIGSELGLVAKEAQAAPAAKIKLPAGATAKPAEENPVAKTPEVRALSSWAIIKSNLKSSKDAFYSMITVRMVYINNKPVLIENNKIIVFDQTDAVLRWGTLILKASEKYGLDPAVIAAVIEQESGGNAQAQSPAGAIGLMQLMPGTARFLKVDPYSPEQNIDGGTRYLVMQLKEFGNLEQALAAYNAGPNNVKNGRYNYISETQGYIHNVPRLVMKYQEKFRALEAKK